MYLDLLGYISFFLKDTKISLIKNNLLPVSIFKGLHFTNSLIFYYKGTVNNFWILNNRALVNPTAI